MTEYKYCSTASCPPNTTETSPKASSFRCQLNRQPFAKLLFRTIHCSINCSINPQKKKRKKSSQPHTHTHTHLPSLFLNHISNHGYQQTHRNNNNNSASLKRIVYWEKGWFSLLLHYHSTSKGIVFSFTVQDFDVIQENLRKRNEWGYQKIQSTWKNFCAEIK